MTETEVAAAAGAAIIAWWWYNDPPPVPDTSRCFSSDGGAPDEIVDPRVTEAENLMRGIRDINRTIVENMDDLIDDGTLQAAIAARARYWERIRELLDLPPDTPLPVDF